MASATGTAATPTNLVMSTELGLITLTLRYDSAPVTAAYIADAAQQGLYDGRSFYRSDFVIQCGLHPDACPLPNLTVNETNAHQFVSNTRGTCAIAHFDVPDNGNLEFFVNLQANTHLDDAYGGYCVFAEVADDASFATVEKIASAIANGSPTIAINTVTAS